MRGDEPNDPGAPSGAPPWVAGDSMRDMGGPDGASDYRAENFQQPETAVRTMGPPGDPAAAPAGGAMPPPAFPSPPPPSVPAPPFAAPAAQPIPDHSAMPVAPWVAAPMAAVPPPAPIPERDPATDQLYAWLARRGIESEYLTSYERAREIIWGCHPDGPVDPAAVDRAIESRSPTSSPAQLQNLRELGDLLVQYYGAAEPSPAPQPKEPKPASSLAEIAAAAAMELDLHDDSGAGELRIELQDVPGPAATIASEPESAPALELDRPIATPVPQLLLESADELSAAAAPSASMVGDAPLVALDAVPDATDKPFMTGDMPPAGLGAALPAIADSTEVESGWKMPPGVGSAWDPRTRDQRPSEIRKHAASRWLTIGLPLVLVAAAAGAAFYFLGL